MVAAPYENDQNYVNKGIHTVKWQLTVLPVHTTLELYVCRAAKIS
jgi:hypothetical protein